MVVIMQQSLTFLWVAAHPLGTKPRPGGTLPWRSTARSPQHFLHTHTKKTYFEVRTRKLLLAVTVRKPPLVLKVKPCSESLLLSAPTTQNQTARCGLVPVQSRLISRTFHSNCSSTTTNVDTMYLQGLLHTSKQLLQHM